MRIPDVDSYVQPLPEYRWFNRTLMADKAANLITLALAIAVMALALHIGHEIHRLQLSFPGFRDRWMWRRRMALALVIASGLLVLWRWL